MRILMVSDVYFPRVNGVSTSIQTFARELNQKGHHVTLIAPEYGCAEKDKDDALEILRVPSRKVMFDPEDRMMNLSWVMERIDLLAYMEFDVIHIQTPFVAHYLGLKLEKVLGIPVVVTYHTYFEEYLYNYIQFLPKALLRFVARRFTVSQCNAVSRIIVPSQPIENALHGYGVTAPVEVIPTGLNLDAFPKGNGIAFREKFGILQDRPVALYVGRMAHEKNIVFLLRSMKRVIKEMPQVLFLMAGEGPAEKWAQRWVKSNGISENVQFVGYLDRETELLDCYSAADVFVFASRTETQGLVLLESMAVGTPVVSTAVLGTKTVLKQGQGVLIAEEDELEFSANVLEVLRSSQLRQELSLAALEYVKQWSSSAMCDRLIELYHQEIDSVTAKEVCSVRS